MRITVSMPEHLFNAAEQTALQMGISRSTLYALAMDRFIKKHEDRVRRGLNRVYEKPANRGLDELIKVAANCSLTDECW